MNSKPEVQKYSESSGPYFTPISRGRSRDFGALCVVLKGDALCWAPLLEEEENFRFEMVQKHQNNVRNYKFLAKYFFQYFQFLHLYIQ